MVSQCGPFHTATQDRAAAQAHDPDTAVFNDFQLRGNRKHKSQEMQSQSREVQSLWAAWSNLSIQDDILYFRFDAKKIGSTPAYTMGLLRKL